MFADQGVAISLAAGVAAGLAEGVVHPLDTIVCRLQSEPTSRSKCVPRPFNGALFNGLYRGFGPTIIASIPASVAFFTVYESIKSELGRARAAGSLQQIPLAVDYVAGSAVAELLACAVLNPAQVLKQNAQVYEGGVVASRRRRPPAQSHTMYMLRQFSKQPAKLWTGYTLFAAAQLPCVCLTFSIYEALRQGSPEKTSHRVDGAVRHIQTSAICGAIAGSSSSLAFIPADVVKTRMRVAAGRALERGNFHTEVPAVGGVEAYNSRAKSTALAVARIMWRQEGLRAFFRGGITSCIAAGIGSGIYLGSYEAVKTHCTQHQIDVLA